MRGHNCDMQQKVRVEAPPLADYWQSLSSQALFHQPITYSHYIPPTTSQLVPITYLPIITEFRPHSHRKLPTVL